MRESDSKRTRVNRRNFVKGATALGAMSGAGGHLLPLFLDIWRSVPGRRLAGSRSGLSCVFVLSLVGLVCWRNVSGGGLAWHKVSKPRACHPATSGRSSSPHPVLRRRHPLWLDT